MAQSQPPPSPTTLKTSRLYRTLELDRAAINADTRTVSLSFSSEHPVERFFGHEILDHTDGAVRLDRLRRSAPLLLDHNPENQIGVVEEATIAEGRGLAVVRFSRSAKGQEVFQDVQDGIRRNVSVGYQIHTMRDESTKEQKTYRATDWEPLEVSLVSIPADTSVGVGRATADEFEIRILKNEKEIVMAEEKKVVVEPVEEKSAKRDVYVDEARVSERLRVRELLALGDKFEVRELAQKAIEEGTSVSEFKGQVLETRAKAKPVVESPSIGLTQKEVKQYSMVRAIHSMASGKGLALAPFEAEVSEAVAKRMGKAPQGFYLPYDVQTRDLTKGTNGDGGYTVATDLLSASFIDILRKRMMVRAMGATMLGGLVGDVAIPKQTGGATAYWVAENVAPTESKQAFGQLAMTPKTVGAYTDISRKLLLQSSIDVEALVRTDLATVLALAIDLAAINGDSNAGEPGGILGTSGIGSVAGGTDGAAPSYAHMISLWKEVAIDNADYGSLGYLTNAAVIAKLMATEKASNTAQFVVSALPDSSGMTSIVGMKAGVSNQVPANLTKGNSGAVCSAIIFGNWADLIIGQWGSLDILTDPYTGSAAGTVRVRVLQDVDCGVRHAESFAAMKDAKTA
jgi:HK97 family phage major capsid protein